MKRIILAAPLLLVLGTAFSAWTDEAHHDGTREANAAIDAKESVVGEENMHRHMRQMVEMGGMGMMESGMTGGMGMAQMPAADCRAIMSGKMAVMREMM